MEEFIERYGGNERNLQVYVFLFEEMSRSLTLMHSTRTCHKDIRPANFYLQGQLTDLRSIVPKLGFFGIDKEPIGDAYLAPEFKDFDKINEPADTWALGVIFYQMLAGRLPFDRSRTGPPTPLPKYVPALICNLVYDMMGSDPSKRPEMQHVNSRLMSLLVQVMQSPTLLKLEDLKFTLSSKHPVIEEKKRGLGPF
jgi:serine/threonine protein kinase